MKKILVLLFVTCFLVTGNCSLVTAQVKIGGDPETGPVAGAVLDLSDASTGGLQLPQVTLTVKSGEGAIPDSWNTSSLPDGLMVYNLGGEDKLPEGVYVWKDEAWEQAGSGGSDTPLMNVAITPNTPVTLYTLGGSQQLNPAISIADSTTIIWKSSNTDVAVVSDKGVVSPVADGEAEITVSFGSTTSDPVAVTVTTPICGVPFTALSGKVYNTARYANAGLTNLCWIVTHLQEAGYKNTCYADNCTSYPTRGYYYTYSGAVGACAGLGSFAWRLPTRAEAQYLVTALPELTTLEPSGLSSDQARAAWQSSATAAGGYSTYWYNWDKNTHFYAENPYTTWYIQWNPLAGSHVYNTANDGSKNFGQIVRCVREV